MDHVDPAQTRARSPRPVDGTDVANLELPSPRTRLQLAELLTRATIEGLWNRRTFRDVKRFFLVLGCNRSGSTLVGSLLNAHPEMVIANEADALRYVRPGVMRNTLFAILLQRDREFAAIERRFHGFEYSVPDGYQGRFSSLRVIGDKHAGRTTARLRKDPDLLERVRSLVGVPIRVLHLVRNPFDNIASIARNREVPLSRAMDVYRQKGTAADQIRTRLNPDEIFDIRYEQIIADPGGTLRDLCRFIGVDATAHYLRTCTTLVDAGGRRARDSVTWSAQELGIVEDLIASRPCLNGYSFSS